MGRKAKTIDNRGLGSLNPGQGGPRVVHVAISLASFFLFSLVAGLVLFFGVSAFYSRKLPSPNKLVNRDVELSTKIYDREEKLLFDVYKNVDRSLVKIEDIPPDLINATLAAEDSEFFLHRGFDARSILRAIRNTVLSRYLQGGSTITQQLVKNALLTNERSFSRKLKEFILAIQIEKKFTKKEILQIYFNEIPYGGPSWGIGAAAQTYFGKQVKDLTLAESAFLAGLPQSPSVYSPYGEHPEKGLAREKYVLRLMSTKGWINADGSREYLSNERAEKAKEEAFNFVKSGQNVIKAPHFVMYVKRLLEERYGESTIESGGLQVKTTLDLDLQEKLQKIVAEEVDKAKGLKVGNGALVAIDPKTGQILALVGSKDYFDLENEGNFNVTIDGPGRQPGSSIKPITYVTALEKGFTASTLIMDVPMTFPGGDKEEYKPVNYDGKFRGPLSLRSALANSINIPAVKILAILGVETVIDTARKLGITSLTDASRYGLSLTLGGGEVHLLELTGAFSVFAAGGIKKDLTPILEVHDSHGNLLESYQPSGGLRVLSEDSVYILNNILSDDSARALVFGTNSLLKIPNYNVAVKTGTTDDKRDNYAIGYAASIVVGAWVGNNDNSPMDPRLASGITGATPIWHRSIVEFLKGKKDEPFKRSENIVEVPVDVLTGFLPAEGFPARIETFVKGTEPKTVSDMYLTLKVCNIDGKIASQGCIDQGQSEEKKFIKPHDPNYQWQDFNDKWIEENYKDKPEFNPPKETSGI